MYWRKGRDSNPRSREATYTLSKRALSTTQTPFQNKKAHTPRKEYSFSDIYALGHPKLERRMKVPPKANTQLYFDNEGLRLREVLIVPKLGCSSSSLSVDSRLKCLFC